MWFKERYRIFCQFPGHFLNILWRKTCRGQVHFLLPQKIHFLHISGTENNCTCHGVHVWRQKCAALYVVPPPAGHQLVVTWHIWLVQKTLEWCSVSTEGTEHVPSACTQVSGQCVGSYACGLISSRLLKSGPKITYCQDAHNTVANKCSASIYDQNQVHEV